MKSLTAPFQGSWANPAQRAFSVKFQTSSTLAQVDYSEVFILQTPATITTASTCHHLVKVSYPSTCHPLVKVSYPSADTHPTYIPQPWGPDPVSVSMDLVMLDTSDQWNHTIYGLLCPISFTDPQCRDTISCLQYRRVAISPHPGIRIKFPITGCGETSGRVSPLWIGERELRHKTICMIPVI